MNLLATFWDTHVTGHKITGLSCLFFLPFTLTNARPLRADCRGVANNLQTPPIQNFSAYIYFFWKICTILDLVKLYVSTVDASDINISTLQIYYLTVFANLAFDLSATLYTKIHIHWAVFPKAYVPRQQTETTPIFQNFPSRHYFFLKLASSIPSTRHNPHQCYTSRVN